MEFFETEGVEKEEDGSDEELTMAHQAAVTGDIGQLLQAIKNDPSALEQVDAEGLTPLARAVMAGQLEVVKRLVKIGASLHAQDELGRTVLAMAAYQGWYDGVHFLLRNGAKQNVCDKAGRTPLHAATYDSDPRTLNVLLQNITKNEVNIGDYEGMTALHWTAFHDRPKHLELLLEKGGDTSLEDIDGKTCLHWAAQNGSLKCCQVLLTNPDGAKLVNRVDHSGKSAVHFAAAAGHGNILKLLATVPGCDLECEDPDERTPLHWAAATGQAESASILLELGVLAEPIDAEGGTPLDYAKQTHHTECINVFEQHLGMNITQPVANGSTTWEGNPSHPSDNPPSRNPFSFFKDFFSRKSKQKSASHSASATSSENANTVSNNKPESHIEKLHLSRLDNPRAQQQKPSRDLDLPVGGKKSPVPPSSSSEHLIRSPPPVLGNPIESEVKKSKKHVTVVPPTSVRPQQLAPLKGAPKLGALPPSLMHEKVAALRRETAKHRTPTPPATLEQVLESQARSHRKLSLSSNSNNSNSSQPLSDGRSTASPASSDGSQHRKKKSRRKDVQGQMINNMREDSVSLSVVSDGSNTVTVGQTGSVKLSPSPRLEAQEPLRVRSKSPQAENYKQQRMELDKHLQGLLY